MKYPITLEMLEQANLKVQARKNKASTKDKIKKASRVIASVQKLKILPLDEAAKRLNDDEVWVKASKGFRFDE